MKEDISELRTEMNEIKRIVKSSVQSQGELTHKQQDQQHPHQLQQQGHRNYSHVAGTAAQPSLSDHLPREENDRKKALELLELGRRTVSLHPFQKRDIEFEVKRGAKDETEAKLWAVQTYFRYEMNIKSHVLATFSIDNIFTPATENYDTIYVTFSTTTEANTVLSYTKNMRKAASVGIYVPKEWQERSRP